MLLESVFFVAVDHRMVSTETRWVEQTRGALKEPVISMNVLADNEFNQFYQDRYNIFNIQ